MTETNEGWGWPIRTKKAHYFKNGVSLCGKWGFGGAVEQSNDNSPDNCKACRKKLAQKDSHEQK
jgi:hypothetical protein